MAINTNGIKLHTNMYATMKYEMDHDPPKASFQCRPHANPPGYSASLTAKRYGEKKAIATIQVARMKIGHSFELMSGERRGYNTAQGRIQDFKRGGGWQTIFIEGC